MAASEATFTGGVYFGGGGPPLRQLDAMRPSNPDQKPQQRFCPPQRQAAERTDVGEACIALLKHGNHGAQDALLPLAHFKNYYRSPFMCEDEKKKRLHWLEREEHQYLSRTYPWHTAQGEDLMRYHLAAIVIQSEFRAWRARQALRALKEAAEALKQEEVARQRQSAVRLLRQQAKDLLLTLYAQGQYGKTRDRLQSAKGHLSGPSLEDLKIDVRLWEKVQQLGLNPVEVLAGQMTTKQIKLVLNASSIRNSGMLPQRPQDLGVCAPGLNGTGRLLNAQDSFLTGNALPMSKSFQPDPLNELFPTCILSSTHEPERLANSMSEARACLPLLASTTSLDGSLDWLNDGVVAAARAAVQPGRPTRQSHPSGLRQLHGARRSPFLRDGDAADGSAVRAGYGSGLLQPSPMLSGIVSAAREPEAQPAPKVVQQLFEYSRTPKAARPGILKLSTGHMASHSPAPSPSQAEALELAPTKASWVPPTKASWVLSSTGVVGSRPPMRTRDPLTASADGPLFSRTSRRPASMAGNRLQAEHSEGDVLLACSGKSMSRTCRMSESGGANYNLPPLALNPSLKH